MASGCGLSVRRSCMEITVQKLSDEELRSRGVFQWPIWEKDVSHED